MLKRLIAAALVLGIVAAAAGWFLSAPQTLSGSAVAALPEGDAGRGELVFWTGGCASCHASEAGARGPSLVGLFGQEVPLTNGTTVIADEAYLRESILNPRASIVAGYSPIMPTYEGIISEDGLIQLVAYLKSLEVE